jgi:phospholipase C
MRLKHFASTALGVARTGVVSAMIVQLSLGSAFAASSTDTGARDNDTATPIKHVIVIIGENRSFDHVFATYVPKKGETVWNLLSEGIINADGTPGKNFSKAEQKAATDEKPDEFTLNPTTDTFKGSVLPAPLVGGPTDSYVKNDSLTLAQQSENGLPADYYAYLVTGGQRIHVLDAGIGRC